MRVLYFYTARDTKYLRDYRAISAIIKSKSQRNTFLLYSPSCEYFRVSKRIRSQQRRERKDESKREEREITILSWSLAVNQSWCCWQIAHCLSSPIAIFLQACLDSFVAREKNAGAGYTAAPIRAANISKTESRTVGEACPVLIALRKSC